MNIATGNKKGVDAMLSRNNSFTLLVLLSPTPPGLIVHLSRRRVHSPPVTGIQNTQGVVRHIYAHYRRQSHIMSLLLRQAAVMIRDLMFGSMSLTVMTGRMQYHLKELVPRFVTYIRISRLALVDQRAPIYQLLMQKHDVEAAIGRKLSQLSLHHLNHQRRSCKTSLTRARIVTSVSLEVVCTRRRKNLVWRPLKCIPMTATSLCHTLQGVRTLPNLLVRMARRDRFNRRLPVLVRRHVSLMKIMMKVWLMRSWILLGDIEEHLKAWRGLTTLLQFLLAVDTATLLPALLPRTATPCLQLVAIPPLLPKVLPSKDL